MPSSQVMKKFKGGRLHSGSKHGPLVRDRAQAVAIMLSEARNEKQTGSPDRYRKPKRRKA